jgi:peptidoglycan-associated lipoprotein
MWKRPYAKSPSASGLAQISALARLLLLGCFLSQAALERSAREERVMKVRSLVVVSAVLMSVGLAGCDSGPKTPVSQPQTPSQPQTQQARPAGTEPATSAKSSEAKPAGDLKAVHFDLDQAKIRPEDARLLEGNARWLKSHRDMVVVVGGHADERGTDEHNARLSERRANAVKQHLVRHGVEGERIRTASHGEREPVCADRSEGCWQKNRRADFQVKPK